MNEFAATQAESNEAFHWYALRVKTGSEQSVAQLVRNKGFEEFLPVGQIRRRWSDRIRTVQSPLFPGYIFCRIQVSRRLAILTIPGALHIVGCGRVPIPVDEEEIVSLKTAVESGVIGQPYPYPEAGDRVRIQYGPLAGVEGVMLESGKHRQIIVSVTLLRRSVALAVDREWVDSCACTSTALPPEALA